MLILVTLRGSQGLVAHVSIFTRIKTLPADCPTMLRRINLENIKNCRPTAMSQTTSWRALRDGGSDVLRPVHAGRSRLLYAAFLGRRGNHGQG